MILRLIRRLIAAALLPLALGCSEEQQNRISRIGVSWLEGDYSVTFAEGNHLKTWRVIDGKVTSEPQKGYYYFWATTEQGKIYVQSPIARTYIEETP